MEIKVYTLLAYRVSCVDTCMGCYMGSSQSDFDYYVYDDIDSLVTTMIDYKVTDYKNKDQREYADYELIVLLNGEDPHDLYMRGESEAEFGRKYQVYNAELNKINGRVEASLSNRIKILKQKEKMEKRKLAIKEATEIENDERVQLAALKEKYENG